jgi:hypothetical protein
MKSLVLAAGLLAAAAATTTARAADLDEGPPPDRYGAYQDPRYYDMYAHPRPAYAPPGAQYGGGPPPYAQYVGPPPGAQFGGPPLGAQYGGPPPDPGYDGPPSGPQFGGPPGYPPPSPRYGDGGPPRPPGYVYRDDYRDADDVYRGRSAYAEPPPYAGGCAAREAIKERLLHQGWRDFRDAEERGTLATIIAHRPNGRPFALTLDRCSGDIVSARPLDEGHFAYGPPPRRWPY